MTFINADLTELVKGYDQICESEAKLRCTWRHRLLAAYAQRRKPYDLARAAYRERLIELAPKLVLALALVLVLFAALFYFWPVAGWSELVLGLGLMGWFGRKQITTGRPTPPLHPFRSPLQEKLFPPLIPKWREQLQTSLPSKVVQDGDVGEYEFLRLLHQLLDDQHFVLHSWQPYPHDDADVIVIGPKGLWVFEVKYWSGEIIWKDGQWQRYKTYFGAGGIEATEEVEVRQPPDQQWQRMADEVTRVMRQRAPKLVASHSWLGKCQGGLVFTHPKAVYRISSKRPFKWGQISAWKGILKAAPIHKDWNEYKSIQILEALLAHHQQVNRNQFKPTSMHTYAKRLLQQSESRLITWIHETKETK